jgi:hypothetical protein
MTRPATVLVAVLVAAGLSACSPDRVGSAAVIDGRPVSTAQLQSLARAHLEIVPGTDAGQAQRDILQRMIVSAIIDHAAREAGVGVRRGRVAAERDAVLDQVGGRKGLVRALAQSQQPTVLAPQEIERWVKDRLLFNALAAYIAGEALDPQSPEAQQALNEANEALSRAARRVEVEVSPRYGRWNPDRGLSALVSGGLSKTAGELAEPR